MKVDLDNLWATQSTLHGRVHCWADDLRWHHSYDVHVPLSTIPREAIEALWHYYSDLDDGGSDQPLF